MSEAGTMTFFYRYLVPADASVKNVPNTVTVQGTDPEGTVRTDEASKSINVRHPDLVISKEAITPSDGYVFEDGEPVTFLITVTNNGDGIARNVKLTDIWDTGGDVTSALSGEENPNSFNVGPGKAVSFTYTTELQGMDAGDLQTVYDGLMAQYSEAISKAQAMIDENWIILSNAFDGYGFSIDDESDIQGVLDDARELVDTGELDESVLNDLSSAVEAYNDKVYGTYDDIGYTQEIADAEDNIANLQRDGLSLTNTITELTNTASFTYNYGDGSDSATVKVKSTQDTDVSIRKYVRLSESDPWRKAVVMDSEGGTAYYKVVIENRGSTVEIVDLTDSKYNYNDGPITIGPYGTREVYYDRNINGNDSYDTPVFDVNTASIVDSKELEHSSCALVKVLPISYAELSIDKKVSLDGESWSKSLAVYSDTPVTVLYRITLTNTGTAQANLALTDDQYSGDLYTDAACGENSKYTGDIDDITLGPLDTLILYYKSDLSAKKTKNTASYETKSRTKPDKDRGHSCTEVVIDPVPKVVLTIEKKVVTAEEYTTAANVIELNSRLGDYKEITNKDGEGDFVFFVKVTNSGNYGAEIKLSDVMANEAGTYDFGDDLNMFDDPIFLDAGATQLFRIPVSVSTGSGDEITYRNTVSIDTKTINPDSLPDGGKPQVIVDKDTDFADIKVTQIDKPTVEVKILKEVQDENGDWQSSATFTADSKDVNYRIKVWGEASDPDLEWEITGNITDDLNAAFDGQYTISNISPVSEWFTYPLTLSKGKYVNTATVNVQDNPNRKYRVNGDGRKSSATSEIKNGGGSSDPGKPDVTVKILKEVQDANGDWKPSATFTADTKDVNYRIKVWGEASDKDLAWEVTGNISDDLNKKFDGQYTISNVNDTEWFTYTLTQEKGKYINTATLKVKDDPDRKYKVDGDGSKSSATSEIKNGSGGSGSSDNTKPKPHPGTTPTSPTTPTTPTTPIVNPDVPLATIPEKDVIIPEKDVPLADIPQTGIDGMAFNMLMLGFSLSAIRAMLAGRKRKTV